jgi:hypothetical protein
MSHGHSHGGAPCGGHGGSERKEAHGHSHGGAPQTGPAKTERFEVALMDAGMNLAVLHGVLLLGRVYRVQAFGIVAVAAFLSGALDTTTSIDGHKLGNTMNCMTVVKLTWLLHSLTPFSSVSDAASMFAWVAMALATCVVFFVIGSNIKMVQIFAGSSVMGVLLMVVEIYGGVWWPSGIALTIIFVKDLARPTWVKGRAFLASLNDMHGSRAKQTTQPFGMGAMQTNYLS